MNKLLLFVTGCSGAGKSTFLEAVKATYGDAVHLVQVGKLLRAKYGESYFKGEAAPAHTQKEATELMTDAISKALDAHTPYIIVDGQPRTTDQVDTILETYGPYDFNLEFLHLYAPENIRRSRLLHRDMKDKEALKLSLTRCEGDIPKNYDVQCYLIPRTNYYRVINTSCLDYNPLTMFKQYYEQLTPFHYFSRNI